MDKFNFLTSLEICAGAGGQALGLESAGFCHVGLIEIEPSACATLNMNRPEWNVIQGDLREFSARPFRGVDLLAGGVPCPPFSKAGKQLGESDERDLFPEAIRLTSECQPKAVLLENVRGLLDPVFKPYRQKIINSFQQLGYIGDWRLINASEHGVSQLRPRAIFVAFHADLFQDFSWPQPQTTSLKTVGQLLYDLMAANGWHMVEEWSKFANDIAPTLVGGSKKHGGPDLGPTRAKRAWAKLGVDGHGIADKAPDSSFVGFPKLTTRMTARVQGFPDDWAFSGKKTAAYRQIGNAFPPPVAHAVGAAIRQCIERAAFRSVNIHGRVQQTIETRSEVTPSTILSR